MKIIKFSIIVFALLFSVQFVKAQSISIGASFGHYPRSRVVVAANYPAYGYYDRPVYYGYAHRAYYGRPNYYHGRYYARPVYYQAHRHYRCW
jgi:hypothetical protein